MKPHLRGLPSSLCCGLLLAMHGMAAAEPIAFEIAPGRVAEHCLRLQDGESIRWRFTASVATDFNIHRHRGERVFYPVRREGAVRASGSFRSGAADDYCLMWSNRGAVAGRVRGSVERRP